MSSMQEEQISSSNPASLPQLRFGCTHHPSQIISVVCLLDGELLCQLCTHPDDDRHSRIPLKDFVDTANQRSDRALEMLQDIAERIDTARQEVVDHLDSARIEVSSFFERWSEEMEEYYAKLRGWLQSQISKHTINRIKVLGSVGQLRQNLLRCLPLAPADLDNYLEWMDSTVGEAISAEGRTGEHIQGMIYSAQHAGSQIHNHLRTLELSLDELRAGYLSGEEQSDDSENQQIQPQIPHQQPPRPNSFGFMAQRNIFQNVPFFTPFTPSTPFTPFTQLNQFIGSKIQSPYVCFTLASSVLKSSKQLLEEIFPEVSTHSQEDEGSMKWSRALSSNNMMILKDILLKKESLFKQPGITFLTYKLIGAEDRAWRVKILSLFGRISFGFGEVTSNAYPHIFYCMDSSGEYHSNSDQQPWKSFLMEKDDIILFRTSSEAGDLRIWYSKEGSTDEPIALTIEEAHEDLRFFVVLEQAGGDSVQLLQLSEEIGD